MISLHNKIIYLFCLISWSLAVLRGGILSSTQFSTLLKTQDLNKLYILYPSPEHLSKAINNEFFVNQKSSIRTSESWKFTRQYFACTSYWKGRNAIAEFRRLNRNTNVVFASATDNNLCLSSQLSVEDLQKLRNSSHHYHVIYPVPSPLKIDLSVLSAIFYQFANASAHATTHTELGKKCNNREKNCEVLASTQQPSHLSYHCGKGDRYPTLRRVHCHPILNDIDERVPLELSIILSAELTVESHEKILSSIHSTFNNDDDVLNIYREKVLLLDVGDSVNANSRYDLLKEMLIELSSDRHSQTLFDAITPEQRDHAKELVTSVWSQMYDQLHVVNDLYGYCGINELLRNAMARKRNLIIHIGSYLDSTNAGACVMLLAIVLAENEQVLAIGLSPSMRLLNNLARPITQYGTTDTSKSIYSAAGLDGTGVIVGVCDSGVDQSSCFFQDPVNGNVPVSSVDQPVAHLQYRKVIQYVNFSGSSGDWRDGHGSHVCGTVLGQSLSDKNSQFNGIAPGSKLAMFDIGQLSVGSLAIPYDLRTIYSATYSAGGRIHSNSWGGGYWYDSFSLETDTFLHDNDDMVLVYAAGNSGGSGIQTVLSPALSKNVIAVAASHNGHFGGTDINHIALFSSTGPAPDGRIKPDIAAPGFSTQSADASSETSDSQTCSTTIKSGTSMAAPCAGGNIALIRQYFQDSNFWYKYCNQSYPLCHAELSPSGSLIKAIVLQSGSLMSQYEGTGSVGRVPLTSTPDAFQGYGRIMLSNVLPIANHTNFDLFVDTVTLPELTEIVYEVYVNDTEIPLRVTISWYDPPNEVFASRLLLNDIDLVVENPLGKYFYGNIGSSRSKDGVNPPLGSRRDETNNNEQVVITSPAITGIWKVHIQSKLLLGSLTQKVSIVITSSGYVQGDGLNGKLHPLNSDFLDKCSYINSGSYTPYGENRTEIGVALWSLVSRNAWATTSTYAIKSTDHTKSDYSYTSSWGDSSYNRMFRNDELCLPSSCYDAELTLSDTLTHAGTQLSMPGCEIYLTPLTKKQSFCVVPSYHVDQSIDMYGIDGGLAGYCLPSCRLSDHIDIPVVVLEDSGEGWKGAYYAVQSMNPQNGAISYAGSLQWGFLEQQNICLPSINQCYYMELSLTPRADADPLNPQVAFGMIDSLQYNDDAYATSTVCDLQLSLKTATLAQICVNISQSTAEIKFLKSKIGTSYTGPLFGQNDVKWEELERVFKNCTKVGACTVPIIKSKSWYVEAMERPTMTPSLLPKTESPTSSPTHIWRNNVTCLSTCSNFDIALFDIDFGLNNDIPSDTCAYLMQYVYADCTSFSIGNGQCQRTDCTLSCDDRTWCSFGSSASTSCSGSPVDVYTSLRDQCISSMKYLESVTSISAQSSNQSSVVIHNKALFGFLVIFTIFCLWEILQFIVQGKISVIYWIVYYGKHRSGNFSWSNIQHTLLQTDSSHHNRNPSSVYVIDEDEDQSVITSRQSSHGKASIVYTPLSSRDFVKTSRTTNSVEMTGIVAPSL